VKVNVKKVLLKQKIPALVEKDAKRNFVLAYRATMLTFWAGWEVFTSGSALNQYSSLAPFASLREKKVLCKMISQTRSGPQSGQLRPAPALKTNSKIAYPLTPIAPLIKS
jgi:hypothetical protein